MKSSTIWVLVAGLAIGFIIGRELPRRGGGDGSDEKSTAAKEKQPNDPSPAGAAKAAPAPAPAPRPSVNQKIQLAKWTPVKGPATAKVTMVVFSDFQ
jgi:hypothetical protein